MGAWSLVYEGFDPEQEGLREALCTLGNGFFATRGALPCVTAGDVHYPGTYIAGCYNRLVTGIAGEHIENEDLVNLPNWLWLTFRVNDGDWFDLNAVTLHSYRQLLDLQSGILHRYIQFTDPAGRTSQLTEPRLVSLPCMHLAGLELTLTPLNWSGTVVIEAGLDGTVVNAGVQRYEDLNNTHLRPLRAKNVDDALLFLEVETSQSRRRITLAQRLFVSCGGQPVSIPSSGVESAGFVARRFEIRTTPDCPACVEKIVTLYTSWDPAISECTLAAHKAARRAPDFEALSRQQSLAWGHLWERFDIAVEHTDPDETARIALILRLHLFHLFQTTSVNTIDLDAGVPARGWHGEAYRGHVFWDEIFVLPLLNYRIPVITRAALLYRFRRLDEARAAAREAGIAGALFPWQSGSSGREESQRIHLNPRSSRWISDNTWRQRHINAAIVYNIWQYYQVTGDIDFLYYYGAEMILEIARLFAALTMYNPERARFEIRGVVGPDEYHTGYPETDGQGIDNNAYTNITAVWVLMRALELADTLSPLRHTELCESLGVTQDELDHWNTITRSMYVPFSDGTIISQFEGYDALEEFDWEGYCRRYGDIQRLDRILEAEGDTPNRYKASKQADVLMLFYLFSAEELEVVFTRMGYEFDPGIIPRNIDYYNARTSHGSTLSRIVHSWVLARRDRAQSWALLRKALESDISDIQGGTTHEGIHLGAMAGTVDLVQRAYTGLGARGDTLYLNPSLPNEIRRLCMNIQYRGHLLSLEVMHDFLRVQRITRGEKRLAINVRDELHEFDGDALELTLPR